MTRPDLERLASFPITEAYSSNKRYDAQGLSLRVSRDPGRLRFYRDDTFQAGTQVREPDIKAILVWVPGAGVALTAQYCQALYGLELTLVSSFGTGGRAERMLTSPAFPLTGMDLVFFFPHDNDAFARLVCELRLAFPHSHIA